MNLVDGGYSFQLEITRKSTIMDLGMDLEVEHRDLGPKMDLSNHMLSSDPLRIRLGGSYVMVAPQSPSNRRFPAEIQTVLQLEKQLYFIVFTIISVVNPNKL